MADPRFFARAGPFTLEELAEISGAQVAKDAGRERPITDVSPLSEAGPDDLSFLDNRRYAAELGKSKAGACVLHPSLRSRAPEHMALLVAEDPYRAYARIARAFYPEPVPEAGVHDSAVVAQSAELAGDVSVGPNAVVGEGAVLAAGTRVEAGAVIGPKVEIGEGSVVGANCVLSHCLIGKGVRLHPGVCIGNRGFGFAMGAKGHLDVPQLGRVIVEDGVEIGANSTVDRGAGPDTVIGAGSKIDNLVQIGHNVRLGRGCVLVAQSGIAGSARLEDFVVLAGQSGVAGHLHLGAGAQVGAQSGVMRNLEPGEKVAGSPAIPVKKFFRLVSLLQRMVDKKGNGDE